MASKGTETLKLIIFTMNISHSACRQLISALNRMNVSFQVITVRQELQETMCRMRTDDALFVFLLTNVEGITILNEISSQIQDRKIITILPDDSEYFRSIGCSVLPRFQAFLSDDMFMVAEVATRILVSTTMPATS